MTEDDRQVLQFPAGDSAMAGRIRDFAWGDTPLGAIETWSPALRMAVDLMLGSPQPVHIAWGPELISLYNDGYIAIADTKHPQSLGQPYPAIWAEIWDEIRPAIEGAAFRGEPYIVHDRPLPVAGRPDRPMGWFTTTASPIRDERGRPAGLYTVALETTDRVLAEAGLRQSFEVLFSSIDEGLAISEMIYDRDGNIVDMIYRQTNAAFERHAGVSNVVDRSIFDVLPNVEDHWREHYASVARTGTPIRRQNHQQDVDRWFDCYFARVDNAGRYVVTVFTDITDRKRAEAVLRESETRHRLLIGSLAQAVWETNGDGFVVQDSPSWRNYTGQTLDEWLGYGWLDAVHPEDRAYAERQWREAIAARGSVNADFRLRAPDDTWRWTNVLAAPVPDAAGRIEKWAGMNIDIADRKAVEAAVRENGERQAFLLRLSDALRAEPDADAVANRAIRMLAEHLHLDRCAIATYRPDADAVDFPYQVGNDTIPPLPPTMRLPDFPVAYAPLLDRTCILHDLVERPGPSGEASGDGNMLGMRAMLASIIRRGKGGPPSSLIAAASRARHWDAAEIALVEDAAERIRAAIERARSETLLRQSHEQRQFVLALSDALITLMNVTDIIEAVATRLCDRLGVSRIGYAQVQGDTLTIVHDHVRDVRSIVGRYPFDAAGERLLAAYKAGTTVRVEDIDTDPRLTPEMRDDLRNRQVMAFVDVVLFDDGRQVGLFAVQHAAPRRWTDQEDDLIRDVAERARSAIKRVMAEHAQRESEERFRQFGEASQDVIWTRDARTLQWQYLTPAFESIYGLSREDVLAGNNYRSWLDLIVPEDRAFADAMIQCVREGEAVVFEYRIRRPIDGAVRWIRNTDFPIVNGDGDVLLIGGIGHDLTELRAAQSRLEAVVDNIPQLVWHADAPGRWTWASQQWTDFTGQSVEESRDWGWLASLHPDDREIARAAWARAEPDGQFTAEYRICGQATGLPRWFQTRATPLRDERGAIVEWFGTSTDIDAMRRLQERQQILVKELQHRTFNLMAMVRSAADMTVRSSADLKEFQAKFRDRIDALARVQRLLSRLEENDRVTFGDLVRAELDAIGALDSDKHRVTLEGPDDVHLRSGTVQTLAMAVHELTTNAVKYGALNQAGAHLHVRWWVDRDGTSQPWLHVVWREHGVTMPSPDTATRGTGQGRMLIEKALPYQLQAKTTFEMEEDGVRCSITLPMPS